MRSAAWGNIVTMGCSKAAALCAAAIAIACSTTPTFDDDDLAGIDRCESDDDCDGRTCCTGRCEDLSLSMRACGSCGNSCTPASYCTGVQCAPFRVGTICENPEILVVHRQGKFVDGSTDDPGPDNLAADALAAALADVCGDTTPPAVAPEEGFLQGENEGPLTTGRGTALIVAGGRVFSGIINYLDNADMTPVELVLGSDGVDFQLVSRSQRRVIVADRLSTLSDTHDYVIGQAIYDATSGTQVLNVYGIFRGGTTVGAQYFGNLGQATTAGTRWFVAKIENGSVTRLAGE